jgi:signal transduction histidine kinase
LKNNNWTSTKEALHEYKNKNLKPPDKKSIDENSIKELYDYSISCKLDKKVQEISIRDSGKGIQSRDLNKIFDPFFTTKKIGKGIGLGLSLCRQIIKDHKGKITCESKLNEGTLFKIILPIKDTPG